MPMPTASPSRRTTMLPSVFVAAAGNIYKVVDDAVDPVPWLIRRIISRLIMFGTDFSTKAPSFHGKSSF